MSTTPLLTPQDFAGKIRAKYPGAYDNLQDDELTQRVLSKYPQYGGRVQLAKPPQAPQPNMQQVNLLGGTSQNPDVQRPLIEQIGQLGADALQRSPNPVAVLHRDAQRFNLAPKGDLYPNELTMPQMPAAAAATFFGMGADPEGVPTPAARPSLAQQVRDVPAPTPDAPGMPMRVGKVLANKIPGVKLASDLMDAVRGPEAPPPPKPQPPANWGQGKFGTPVDQWGGRIPPAPPVQPKPRPAPAWQTAGSAGTLVDSVLADKPTTGTWGDRPYPQPPQPAPVRPARVPLWKQVQSEGTEVPSILDREPDVSQEEWSEGHEIESQQENTPRLIQKMGGKPVETITKDPILEKLKGFAAQEKPQVPPANKSLEGILKRSVKMAKAMKPGSAAAD